MPHRSVTVFLLSCVAVLPAVGAPVLADGQGPAKSFPAHALGKTSGTTPTLPLVFTESVDSENGGRSSSVNAFVGQTQAYTVELGSKSLRFHLRGKDAGRTIDVSFEGSGGGTPAGVEDAGFRTNFYLGSDPKDWHTGVRNYDRVALRHLYPGIDAEFYARAGEIEHDFIVAPGGDAAPLEMRLSGAKNLTLTPGGDLVLAAEEGALRLRRPVAYQLSADGKRQPVDAEFLLTADGRDGDLRFKLGAYDHSRRLVIDPVITYATYLSGIQGTTATAVASDSSGNVYVTGSVSPFSAFLPTPAGNKIFNGATPGGLTTFVAELSPADGGSKVAWVTYYGDAAGPVQPSAIAVSPTGDMVFVGGTTQTADLKVTTGSFGQTAHITTGSTGFLLALSAGSGDGAFSAATYIAGGAAASDTTRVTALATNGALITIAGTTTSTTFPTTLNKYPVSSDLTATGSEKGFVLTSNASLIGSPAYSTYVGGYQHTSASHITISGVAVDAGAIYVAGYTDNDFPRAGAYPPASTLVEGDFYQPPTGKAFGTNQYDGFLAKVVPGAAGTSPTDSTLSYSIWTAGEAIDRITGLARSGTDAYVFGTTTSHDLLTNSGSTLATTVKGTPSAVTTFTSLDSVFPAAATTSGFVLDFAQDGSLPAATYLGPVTTSTTLAGVINAGELEIVGTTQSGLGTFPQETGTGTPPSTVSPSGTVPTLPPGEYANFGNSNLTHGFLVEMPLTLDAVKSLASFGPNGGTSRAVGAAAGGSNPNSAYVLLNDTPPAVTGSAPIPSSFTTASALQPAAQVGNATIQSAYLARVEFTTLTGPTIEPGTSTYTVAGSPDGITPAPATEGSQLTMKFQVKGLNADAPAGIVFNLPYTANLQAYTPVTTLLVNSVAQTVNGGGAGDPVCSLGPAAAAATTSGITCVLPAMGANSTAEFDVVASVSAAGAATATTSTPHFVVPAVAYDAEGDTADLSITVQTAQLPTLSITNTATANVNAALTSSDAVTPNTLVTYTYTIRNTGTVDSPHTFLSTKLALQNPYTFTPNSGGVTVVPADCDPTTLQGCDIPAGGTLTYTVKGVYLASQFGSTTSGPFTSTTPAPTVTFTPSTTPAQPAVTGSSPVVTIAANARLSLVLTTSAATYKGGFELGDTGVQLIATVTNAGPNQAGGASFIVTLPAGFVVAPAQTPPADPGATLTCTATACSAAFTGLGGNAQEVFIITGRFSDTGLASDAVAPPLTVAGVPVASTVAGSAVSGSVTVSASALTPATGTYSSTSTPVPLSLKVSRVIALAYSSTTTTTLAGNVVNETNVPHQNDSVTYTYTVTNSGKSVVRGFLINIPIAAAATATVTSVTAVPTSPASPANGLTCAPYVSGGTQILCYENDLTTGGAPTVATTTLAAEAYTVTVVATYNELTVPATQANGKTALPQSPILYYAVSPSYQTASTGAAGAGVTVQRLTNLNFQTYTVMKAPGQQAPASFADQADLNLDEHVPGDAPGLNDTVAFTAAIGNTGPNDALGIVLTIPIPPYMRIPLLPVNCTTTGTLPLITGATGGTVTCTPLTTTTSTTASQIAAGGPNYNVTFIGKFVDSTQAAATLPNTNSKGTEAIPAGILANTDVDTSNTATTTVASTFSSAVPASSPITAQRAAHVYLATARSIPLPTYTDGTVIPSDAGGLPIVAQAAGLINPANGIAGIGKVYNCVRYSVPVLNAGPNYALAAQLTYAIDHGPFVLTQAASTAPASEPPVNCRNLANTASVGANGVQTAPFGTLGYPAVGNTGDAYLDGYFDLGALGLLNSGQAVFTTKSMSGEYNDSNTAGTQLPDYVASQTATLVNTPFNTGAGGIGVTPYELAPSNAVPVTIAYTSVLKPGGTTTTSATSSAIAVTSLPAGKSPYPLDNGASRPLYQPGNKPVVYSAATSAPLPATDLVGFCVGVAPGGATISLPDIFVKPERVLMWALTAPAGTQTYGSVPVFGSDTPTYLTGDITSNVISAVGSYVAVPSNALTFPQVPQAQPARVCGQLNGLAAAAPPLQIALLEPVNFPPYVVATLTASEQPTKGSTVAQTSISVAVGKPVNGVFSKTYDVNDSEPCYTGGTASVAGVRSTSGNYCSDDPYLTAFLYSGGNIEGAGTSIAHFPLTQDATTQLGQPFNLSGGAQIYVAVADQAAGADALNPGIATSPNYSYLPQPTFTNQGGFLTDPIHGGECDPGLAGSLYATTTLPCVNVYPNNAVSSAGNERYVPGGAGYSLGNVGAQQLSGTAAAGSGLIPLPYPSTSPTGQTPSNPTDIIATATLTPGQTAAFTWQWLPGVTQALVSGGAHPGSHYTLSCAAEGAASSAVPACSVTTLVVANVNSSSTDFYFGTETTATSAAPTIFVTTTGNQFARAKSPFWLELGHGAMLALLPPVFFFRRRLGRFGPLVALTFAFSVVPFLSGCGSTGGGSSSVAVTPAGTYSFRVTATPAATVANGVTVTPPADEKAITSAVFEVVVQKAN